MLAVPQPAKAVAAQRRIRNTDIAAAVGLTPAYVGRILNGLVVPSEQVRRDIAAYFGEPEQELFRSDMADEFAAVAEFVRGPGRHRTFP